MISPMISPTTFPRVGGMESQMDEAIMHGMESMPTMANIQAAMQNQGIRLAN